jgi:hypothetical protein
MNERIVVRRLIGPLRSVPHRALVQKAGSSIRASGIDRAQVEIWFSILHRRILRHGDFGSTEHQKNEVEGFIRH